MHEAQRLPERVYLFRGVGCDRRSLVVLVGDWLDDIRKRWLRTTYIESANFFAMAKDLTELIAKVERLRGQEWLKQAILMEKQRDEARVKVTELNDILENAVKNVRTTLDQRDEARAANKALSAGNDMVVVENDRLRKALQGIAGDNQSVWGLVARRTLEGSDE